jgi:hypothetical protein
MGYFLLRASPPGKAISSDACDSDLVAWVYTNQSCREKNQKQQEMIGARFGQASLRRNARRDSRSRVRRTNPRSTSNGNLNKSKLRSPRTRPLQPCRTASRHRYRSIRIRSGRTDSWKAHRISAFNHAIQPAEVLVVGYFEFDPQITGIEKLVNQIDRIVTALKPRR